MDAVYPLSGTPFLFSSLLVYSSFAYPHNWIQNFTYAFRCYHYSNYNYKRWCLHVANEFFFNVLRPNLPFFFTWHFFFACTETTWLYYCIYIFMGCAIHATHLWSMDQMPLVFFNAPQCDSYESIILHLPLLLPECDENLRSIPFSRKIIKGA